MKTKRIYTWVTSIFLLFFAGSLIQASGDMNPAYRKHQLSDVFYGEGSSFPDPTGMKDRNSRFVMNTTLWPHLTRMGIPIIFFHLSMMWISMVSRTYWSLDFQGRTRFSIKTREKTKD